MSSIDRGWQPAQFFRATPGGAPVETHGYERGGLALMHFGWETPRTKTRWRLVHLGSGGCFLQMTGDVATVMPVASEIAECSDWTLFDLPEGWRQTDPELLAKFEAICLAHPEVFPNTSFKVVAITDEDARAVIDAREQAS